MPACRLTVLLLAMPLVAASPASAENGAMTGMFIPGQPLDSRVLRCGIGIEERSMAIISPVLETSTPLDGRYSLTLVKQSASGTSTSSQSNRFHGSFGGVRLMVDIPATIKISMQVSDSAGSPLCEINETITVPTRI
ncbi:curli-like amyloid fiber formation chaperone CsgH [Hartmannibacter diazotrophicus]|nr:curli-like amyloid fiber formation chaperone CsgH [Hartmannibacter diazotrophicus]